MNEIFRFFTMNRSCTYHMRFLPFAWFGDFHRIFYEVDECDSNHLWKQRHSLKIIVESTVVPNGSESELRTEPGRWLSQVSYRISEVPESKLRKHNWWAELIWEVKIAYCLSRPEMLIQTFIPCVPRAPIFSNNEPGKDIHMTVLFVLKTSDPFNPGTLDEKNMCMILVWESLITTLKWISDLVECIWFYLNTLFMTHRIAQLSNVLCDSHWHEPRPSIILCKVTLVCINSEESFHTDESISYINEYFIMRTYESIAISVVCSTLLMNSLYSQTHVCTILKGYNRTIFAMGPLALSNRFMYQFSLYGEPWVRFPEYEPNCSWFVTNEKVEFEQHFVQMSQRRLFEKLEKLRFRKSNSIKIQITAVICDPSSI